MRKRVATVGLLLLVMLLTASKAMAWTAECEANRCGVSTVIEDTEKKQTLLTVAVLQDKTGTNPALMLTVPLGAALEPGARALVDGQEIKLPFKACFPEGCQAFTNLTEAALSTLRSAKTMDVQFFALSNNQPLAAYVDLAGLAEALDKLSD